MKLVLRSTGKTGKTYPVTALPDFALTTSKLARLFRRGGLLGNRLSLGTVGDLFDVSL
jgi:hypothetical protein